MRNQTAVDKAVNSIAIIIASELNDKTNVTRSQVIDIVDQLEIIKRVCDILRIEE